MWVREKLNSPRLGKYSRDKYCMLKRFHFEHIIHFVLRVPRWMGEKPFFGFLILLFLALSISSIVFYRTVLDVRTMDGEGEIEQIRIDQRTFQGILQTWQEREEKFNEAGNVRVRNIFAPEQTSKESTPQEGAEEELTEQ